MTGTRLFERAVVRLAPTDATGDAAEDVADFLQGLLTNDVKGELPAYAGLLSPQGKCLFDMIVWPAGDGEILLDCEAAAADDLVKRLSLYRLRRKIDIRVDESVGVYWQAQLGDGAAPDPRLHGLGQRWVAPVDDTDEAADKAWNAHRLALGVPEGREELGDILWLETNAVELNGVSFEKGCYVGQENTARMNWRQKVNRRLIVLPIKSVDEKRVKALHPDAGLAVAHMRVADLDPQMAPDWMQLTAGDEA